jgi:hypothetical protein
LNSIIVVHLSSFKKVAVGNSELQSISRTGYINILAVLYQIVGPSCGIPKLLTSESEASGKVLK